MNLGVDYAVPLERVRVAIPERRVVAGRELDVVTKFMLVFRLNSYDGMPL